MHQDARQHVPHNVVVNIADGAFFGLGMGMASYVTVIPLFLATLTESAALIGLIAAMHEIGWYLPQLLTARRVAGLRRYKPMAVRMTLIERVPYFAMAILALFSPQIGKELALLLMFLIISTQAIGGGLTATAWQSMIGKIMPDRVRGTFYGLQSSAANLLMSGGAVAAGFVLAVVPHPYNFTIAFMFCGISMMISWIFISMTRELDSEPTVAEADRGDMKQFGRKLRQILKEDVNFRWFIIARLLAMFAGLGLYFFSLYAVRRFGVDEVEVGVMTGILMLATVITNPILGALGDRTSHRLMYAFAVLLAGISGAVAMLAPDASWMYVAFALMGAAKAGLWTIPLPLTTQFGRESDRPYYIGLANTLIAPGAIVAPILGGALAEGANFGAAFIVAAVAGVIGAAVLVFIVREPRSVAYPIQGAENAFAVTGGD